MSWVPPPFGNALSDTNIARNCTLQGQVLARISQNKWDFRSISVGLAVDFVRSALPANYTSPADGDIVQWLTSSSWIIVGINTFRYQDKVYYLRYTSIDGMEVTDESPWPHHTAAWSPVYPLGDGSSSVRYNNFSSPKFGINSTGNASVASLPTSGCVTSFCQESNWTGNSDLSGIGVSAEI